MTLNLNIPQLAHNDFSPRITVIGVGGGGTNAVDNMIALNLQGVEFVVANTDAQQLMKSRADRRVQLGPHLTQGLGAGANPEVGRAAADEAADELYRHLDGAHMVFITAGMGGGTGTGAAPVIARMAKERGILTVGVVTKPFGFEGARRGRAAEAGIAELQQYVDTLIVIPNQNLFNVANNRTTFREAFKMADQVLYMGVRGVTDLMMANGLINLDFADIKAVMAEMGKAMMGTGEAEGEDRAVQAAEAAINNPLLEETSMAGARGLLINITGGEDLTLYEVDEAVKKIRDQVDEEANVIFGSALDASLNGRIRVSVVATGIDRDRYEEMPRPKLVAMGGGGGSMAEPRPIQVPMGAVAAVSQPMAMGQTNVTALRQMAVQPERVIIPDPMPYPEEPAAVQTRRAPVVSAVPRPKAPSSLFNDAPRGVAPAPAAQPESAARMLFGQMTGVFRKRPAAALADAPAVKQEPPPVFVAPAVQELAVEQPERPGTRAPGVEDQGLDIPAFLRRQQS